MVATPGTAVEDAGDSGEQDVAPIEVDSALVEVGQAEESGCEEQRGGAAEAALEKILEPSAKEELFRNGDEEESKEPCDGKGQEGGPDAPAVEPGQFRDVQKAMEMEEAEAKAERERDGHVEGQLAQAGGEVAHAQAEVEADTVQGAQGEETVEAEVEKEDLVEEVEVLRPGGLEPAEIDGEAEDEQDKKILPGAPLFGEIGIGQGGAVEQGGDGDGKQGIEREPDPAE